MWPGAEGMGMKNNPSWTQTNEPQTTVTTDAAPASCAAAPADDDDDDGKWKGNGMKDGRVWGAAFVSSPFWPGRHLAAFCYCSVRGNYKVFFEADRGGGFEWIRGRNRAAPPAGLCYSLAPLPFLICHNFCHGLAAAMLLAN